MATQGSLDCERRGGDPGPRQCPGAVDCELTACFSTKALTFNPNVVTSHQPWI